MKKIIALLFAVGIFATSFAQDNHRQRDRDDRYVYNQEGNYDKGYNPERNKEFQIAQINRKFDFKIRVIQNDYRLRRHQKKVAIRNAEHERNVQIHLIKSRSGDWDKKPHRHGKNRY